MEFKPVRPASGVFDTGRRGEPLRTCDCMTCFGYCITRDGQLPPEAFMDVEIADDDDQGQEAVYWQNM